MLPMHSIPISHPPRPSRPAATAALLPLAAAVVLVILARAATTGHPFMAGDEYAYYAHSRMAGRLDELYASDPEIQRVNNPVFFALGNFVCRLADGDGTALLRLIHTLLFAAGCCVCVGLVGRSATRSDRAGLLLVLVLVPLSSYCLYFMPEILYFFLVTVLTAVIVRGTGPPRGTAAIAAGVVLGALLGTKPHAVAIAAALTVFLVVEHCRSAGIPRGLAAACRSLAFVGLGAVLAYAAGTWLYHGARPPAAGDMTGRVYHGFIADGFAGRFSPATLLAILGRHLALNLSVLAVPLLLLVRLVIDGRDGCDTSGGEPAGKTARSLALWSLLVFGAAVLMSVVFTAIVAISQPSEAMRVHGRYYSFAIPILLAAWVGGFPTLVRRPWFSRWAMAAAAVGAACAVGWAAFGHRWSELYPWDYPELLGMSRWPALGQPAAALPWVVAAAAAVMAIVVVCRPRASLWATGTFVAATFIAGHVNVWRWHSDHARSQGRIADEARAVAALLGPEERARGIVVGEHRYGRMASALFGLGAECRVTSLPSLSTITSAAIPPDVSWLFLADRIAVDVPYETVVEGRETTFYRLRPVDGSGTRHDVVGWGGDPLVVNAAADENTRFVGFNGREGWGRWSALPVARIHLPAHVSGKSVVRFSGWVATAVPQHLTVGLGTGTASVEVGVAPGSVEIPIDAGPGGSVLTFRGVAPVRVNPWDVPRALAVQRVEIVRDPSIAFGVGN